MPFFSTYDFGVRHTTHLEHTESFYETMVIDTPKAGANLAKAIEHYEKYGPYIPKNV